jgi:hypothetical protein
MSIAGVYATNAEWAAQVGTLVSQLIAGTISQAAFVASYQAITESWNPASPTLAQNSRKVSEFIAYTTTRDQDISGWATGTATGGFDSTGTTPGGGYYPVHVQSGAVVYLPSPAKLVQQVAKGDKGDPARMDLPFAYQYVLGASEPLPPFIAADAMLFDASKCKAWAKSVPGVATSMLFNKRSGGGAAALWATVSWLAGNNFGTVTFSGVAALAANDIVEPYGPAVFNPAFQSPTITFAGGF